MNRTLRNNHAAYGQQLYRVHWFDYAPSDDTWKPTNHLPPSKFVSYYKKRKLKIRKNIDDAIDG